MLSTKVPSSKNLCLVSFFLRTGLAIVFLYAAIAATLQPDNWVSFLPSWVGSFMPVTLALHLFSLSQVVLALWLLSNYKPFLAAVVTAIVLAAIILQNSEGMDVIFRDFAILFAAVALAALHRE